MSRLITISVSERAFDILQTFAWGQKSRVLSDYIETLESNPKLETMKLKPELPANPKILASSHKTKEPANYKTSSAPAETSAKNTSTKSSEQQSIRKQLLTVLRSDK